MDFKENNLVFWKEVYFYEEKKHEIFTISIFYMTEWSFIMIYINNIIYKRFIKKIKILFFGTD